MRRLKTLMLLGAMASVSACAVHPVRTVVVHDPGHVFYVQPAPVYVPPRPVYVVPRTYYYHPRPHMWRRHWY